MPRTRRTRHTLPQKHRTVSPTASHTEPRTTMVWSRWAVDTSLERHTNLPDVQSAFCVK